MSARKRPADKPTLAYLSPHDLMLAYPRLMADINKRLARISHELTTLQPKREGSITLDIYDHPLTCLGCPHYRWRIWRVHRKRVKNRWCAHDIRHPVRHLHYFKGYDYEALRNAVHEAVDLLKRKRLLIEAAERLTATMRGHRDGFYKHGVRFRPPIASVN